MEKRNDMKKLSYLSPILVCFLMMGCGATLESTGGTPIKMPPILVEEADAFMVPVQSPVIIKDGDCANGTCNVSVSFRNSGSHQAENVGYSFEITSDAIVAAMSTSSQDTVEPEATALVNFSLMYTGTSVPAGVLGSVNMHYIKNGIDTGTASIEVIKQ